MNLENIDRVKSLISDRECLNEIINEMEKNTPVSIWFSVKQRNKTLNFESNDNEFIKDFVSDVYGFSVEYLRDKLLDIDDKLKDL